MMTRWFVKTWKNPHLWWTLSAEERRKMITQLGEQAKADMDSELVKDRGSFFGRNEGQDQGYWILEGTEAQVYELIVKYEPYMFHEVIPMISREQMGETLKRHWDQHPV